MKYPIRILFLLFIVAGCKNNPSTNTTTSTTDQNNLEPGCYGYFEEGNKIFFEVKQTEDIVTGELIYELSGKDKNEGQFRGNIKGDVLMGWYTFRSEGEESSRQVAFQISDGRLVEGYGPLDEKGT